jgi:hypothetical protein
MIPKNYPFTEAVKQGDIIYLHGKYTNVDKLPQFMDDVLNQKPSSIRIVHYTTEGDPIIEEINYDAQKITYKYDNSRDSFGSPNLVMKVCQQDAGSRVKTWEVPLGQKL